MNNFFASRFDECLVAVKGQVATVERFVNNSNAVRIIADDPAAVPPLTGDHDALVIGGGGTATTTQDGSGRLQTVARRVVEIAVRTRNASDPLDSDQIWATKHLPLEHAVIDRLQLFDPAGPPSSTPPTVAIVKTQAGNGVSTNTIWTATLQSQDLIGFWFPYFDGASGLANVITYFATAADLQTAINASFAPATFTVTGGPGTAYTITATADFKNHDLVVIQNQTSLFREPMRWVGVSKPNRSRKAPMTGNGQWGVSVISFEVVHVLRLDQKTQ